MTHHTPTLTDVEVLTEAQTTLQEHLPLAAAGYDCTTDDLYKVLLGAAVQRGTIEAVCREMVGAPVGNTIRRYLKEQLCVEELSEWEERLNQALAANLPQRIGQKPRAIAMDMHDRAYYGKTSQEAGLWVRGRAKRGTLASTV